MSPSDLPSNKTTIRLNPSKGNKQEFKQEFNELLNQLSELFPGNKFVQTTVICLAMITLLLASGLGGYLIHLPSPSSKPLPSPTPYPNFPDVVNIGYVNYGVIYNVTIIDTYESTLPGKNDSTDFCDTEYSVQGKLVREVFQDIDEGNKTDSGDVRLLCHLYALDSNSSKAGKPVTLVVSGIRYTPTSSFRNILRLIPQDL
jgi:hypothetical protein